MNYADLEKHQQRLKFCESLALRSPDPSNQVGAILYSEYGVSVGVGWNSFPSNMKVDPAYYQNHNRLLKYDRIIHAEMRCLLAASDHAMKGKLYTNLPPCKHCAKHICEAQVTEVLVFASTMKKEWVQRSAAEVEVSMQLFAECGVKFIEVPDV